MIDTILLLEFVGVSRRFVAPRDAAGFLWHSLTPLRVKGGCWLMCLHQAYLA